MSQSIVLVLVSYVVYISSTIIYRIWFSPLADIPGPWLPKVTGWYETYYQLIKGGGGQFTFKIAEWHRKYGPIVRIGPNEVHFSDPEYFDTIYPVGNGINKATYFKYMFSSPGAIFSTVEHDLHRSRKSALLPFFSKKRILDLEDQLQGQIDLMCRRIANEYADKGKPLNVGDMLSCFSADTATVYAFDRTYNWLSYPDFKSPFTSAINALKTGSHFAIQFPWLAYLMYLLPDSVLGYLVPNSRPIIKFKQEMRKQITDILEHKDEARMEREQRTIFTNLLSSDLPESEMTIDRLTDEGTGVVGAGIETTKWTTLVTFFYLVNQPEVLDRLRKELNATFPDESQPMALTKLEKLPWLGSCIEEGLRLSYGGVARSPRTFQTRALQYGKYTIPPGTAVSTDAWTLHHDETIFPDSFTFDPSRWLPEINKSLSSSGAQSQAKKNLRSYLVAFGKGTRICLGMQLAYAQMQFLLANLFMHFDFEFYETDRSDVDCVRDEIAPGVKKSSKGVRVIVHSRGVSSSLPHADNQVDAKTEK